MPSPCRWKSLALRLWRIALLALAVLAIRRLKHRRHDRSRGARVGQQQQQNDHQAAETFHAKTKSLCVRTPAIPHPTHPSTFSTLPTLMHVILNLIGYHIQRHHDATIPATVFAKLPSAL